jgi:hypothetical protein
MEKKMTMSNLKKSKLHPIFIPGEFIVKTPMMSNLLNTIYGWVANGYTGGVVLGEVRIGKTFAIEYLKSNLINRAREPIPVVSMSVSKRDVKTIASIFRNICFAIGKKVLKYTIADNMANELIHYFGELSLTNQTRQVVLVVDEMQRLSLHQFEAFAELYDKLAETGTNLIVVFVGNESDSSPTIKNINSNKYELISGRFFNHRTKYHGIRNIGEVKATLKQFDTIIFKSHGSKTASEYFLAETYMSGWRYEHLSDLIWSVFKEKYKDKYALKSWPMQYFMVAVKLLLTDYLPKFGTSDNIAIKEMINKCILASQLTTDTSSIK